MERTGSSTVSSQTMEPRAIFLVGFMGCGKSTCGTALGKRLGWPFVDLDNEIEKTAGKPISQIFTDYGEEKFRQLEHEALQDQLELIQKGSSRLVALGGGAFTFSRNRDLLKDGCISIWLDADTDTLWNRVRNESNRPLAQHYDSFSKLHESRQKSYSKADHCVDASGNLQQVIDKILGILLLKRTYTDG